MTSLASKKCQPCEGGVAPMTGKDAGKFLGAVKDWKLVEKNKKIEKNFKFKNFKQAINFINQVAAVAEDEGHHPDILIFNWNRARLSLSTHAIGGLSENDFILAAKIDSIGATDN